MKTQVWSYGADRVLGTIGYVPIEEYAFFVLQTVMTSLWIFFLMRKIPVSQTSSRRSRWLGGLLLTALTLFGFYCLNFEKTRYLGLILAWATPVALLQWLIGGKYLFANARLVFWSILPPTVYLWIGDGLAIHWEIWTISPQQTVGFQVGSLPLEEAVFFLATNVMVSFGLVLFVAMREVIRLPFLSVKTEKQL